MGAEDCASGEVPFRRAAIRCAMGGGSLRNCDSAVIFTVMDFFETKSWTVMVPADASSAEIGPAIFRNVPETISSAVNSAPSALRVPRARSWNHHRPGFGFEEIH